MSSQQLTGVGVSPGQATGLLVKMAEAISPEQSNSLSGDPALEADRIDRAARTVADRLTARAQASTGEAKALLDTTAAIAMDPTLVARAREIVSQESVSADVALRQSAGEVSQSLREAGSYLAQRVGDIENVRDRIIAELIGLPEPGIPAIDTPAILVARDLAPADTALLDPALVLGIVTEEGGPTSHTAIIARSLGIPAVVACTGIMELAAEYITINGDSGVVMPVSPEKYATTSTDSVVGVAKAATHTISQWTGNAEFSDGKAFTVYANVGSAADAHNALAAHASGIGLFRTEFQFLTGAHAEPTVAQQREAYAQVLAPFAGKPVIVRTLDAGADKPLPFLSTQTEPNPALGVRGVRIAKAHPEVLERQLAAIHLAGQDSGAAISVMAPMVATPEEAHWFVTKAKAAGIARAGVMIEIPAAALLATEVLQVVDFVSIGTNDLAQYVFAADRQLGSVAGLNNPWQPALLRLIHVAAKAGRTENKSVGVCGEAAVDPLLAGVLIGLGVMSLSMNPAAIPRVGVFLESTTHQICERAAEAALEANNPDAAKQAANAVFTA